MNKSELAEAFAREAGLTKKDSNYYIDILLDCIKDSLCRGEKVQLTGFGTLEVRERKAFEGYNPSTGENIGVPAVRTVCFKPGKDLKEKL